MTCTAWVVMAMVKGKNIDPVKNMSLYQCKTFFLLLAVYKVLQFEQA
jgi:hypothetical protein